jgi:hypothetical protein
MVIPCKNVGNVKCGACKTLSVTVETANSGSVTCDECSSGKLSSKSIHVSETTKDVDASQLCSSLDLLLILGLLAGALLVIGIAIGIYCYFKNKSAAAQTKAEQYQESKDPLQNSLTKPF